MMIVGNLKEEVEQVKKKLGLAALLMAVLLLVPSFAMAAPAEEPTTVVYTLQVPVVNENGANYEIPLKITLYDVYEDSDLSKLVSVQKAAEGTSFELWLNLSGVSLGSITGIDHNGNYVSIYARSTGYYKGSWYSSKPGFKSLSTRGSHTCSYGNTVTTQPSCEAGGGTSRTCIYCGHKDVKTTGNALGHEFGEYIYDNNATCLADGAKTSNAAAATRPTRSLRKARRSVMTLRIIRTTRAARSASSTARRTGKCTRCGATDTVTDPGTALEHIFGEYVADNNASCSAGRDRNGALHARKLRREGRSYARRHAPGACFRQRHGDARSHAACGGRDRMSLHELPCASSHQGNPAAAKRHPEDGRQSHGEPDLRGAGRPRCGRDRGRGGLSQAQRCEMIAHAS